MTFRKNLLIVTYLAVQILLPLHGFVQDKFESRGDFTWNMYTRRFRCRVAYVVGTLDGRSFEIDHRRYFQRPNRAMSVMHRDVLPRFHAWLCDNYERQGNLAWIRARASCSLDGSRRRELIDPRVDICSMPNYGVYWTDGVRGDAPAG